MASALLLGFIGVAAARGAVIGHWTFNEGGGGTAKDTSTSGNDGSIAGGAGYISTPGLFGISLDGGDDVVNFGQLALFDFTTDDFTVEAWVAIDGSQTGNNHGIFGKSGNSWLLGYQHDSGTSARHNVQICGPAGCNIAKEAPVGSATPFGTFRHVAFTKSTSESILLYVDGTQASVGGGGLQPIDSEAVDVVAGRGSGNFLQCIIDEIKVHDTYLSAAAISNSFATGPSLVTNPITPIMITFIDRADISGFDNKPIGWNDYNQDGFPDFSVGGPLHRNNGGTGFTVPVGGFGFSIWADWDNDGDQDAFNLNLLAQPKFMRYDGSDTFAEIAVPALTGGLDNQGACWADFNGDSYLDIYVGAYEETGYEPDSVLINNAGASFTRVLVEPGGGERPGRGVTACDFDKDGDMDVYVSNYRLQPNWLWRNNGSGAFTDVAPGLGADGFAPSNPTWNYAHTIGSAWGDMNNDGHFDLFVGNFAHPENWCGGCARQPESQFLENQGPPIWNFVDRAGTAGLAYQESYASPSLADYDNDGDLDLFFSTVNSGDTAVLYRNNGNWSFSDVTSAEGVGGLANSSQSAWADFNNDGFMDLTCRGRLFENQGNANHWVKVRLEGDGTNINRDAIGAQVRIDLGGGNVLARQVEAGTGHGNQNEPTLHFGLASRTAPVTLNVFWPDGTTKIVPGVAVDQTETVSYTPSAPFVLAVHQALVGDAVGLCFTGEVGTVYSLNSADLLEGPYIDTGASISGSGGISCLFDPKHAAGIDTSKFYRVLAQP
jgi:hypothetical protein